MITRAQRPSPLWTILRATAVLTFQLVVPTASVAGQHPLRPLEVEDLFRMEQLGEVMGDPVAVSPDGAWLVYVRVRPKLTAGAHNQPHLWGNDYADIWLAPAGGGESRRITEGASLGAGAWAPTWAPDGRHLTFLSTEDGNIRVNIWEHDTGALRRITEAGTDPWQGEAIWLSDTEIVLPVLPDGETALAMSILQETPRIAVESWARVREGQQPTAAALESGVPIDLNQRPHGRLLVHDVQSGETQVLFDGDVRHAVRAPDSAVIAGFIMTSAYVPRPDRTLSHEAFPGEYQVRVFTRDGALPPGPLATVENALPGSITWSPDGTQFAFAGRRSGQPESSTEILTFAPAQEELGVFDLGDLEPLMPAVGWLAPPEVRWSGTDKLVVKARKPGAQRADWWLVDRPGSVRSLTGSMPSAPATIHRAAGAAGWVGIVDGDVWHIPETVGAEPVNLTTNLDERITGFAWINEEDALRTGVVEVLVESRSGPAASRLYRLGVTEAGQITEIRKPSPSAQLAAYSPEADVAVFSAKDRRGTYLWTARLSSRSSQLLLETNTFLREVAEASSRKLEYRSLDGDPLTAWMLLPIGYEEGRQYPVVTWVYAGSMANPERPTTLADLNNPHPLNLQLLTARGYVVLLPSMPLTPTGTPSDPYLDLTKGVLPAIDKLIDLGIADPDRLAVMGQSYGGYSTFGLITQTDRFAAAVSLAGVSDLVSLYGQFDARRRYADFAHEHLFGMSLSERGQLRLGSPPWVDLQRYIRNSPITYVERVNTPLLITQGDLDYVPLQQGEVFFQALHRQGKRAKFVRYWGEGHVLASPANIVDMWNHVFTWLEEHLDAKAEEEETAG